MIDDPDVAQAAVLVAALAQQIDHMSARLSKVERDGVRPSDTHRAMALRRTANGLRRDINHAEHLIRRLHHRYPTLRSPANH